MNGRVLALALFEVVFRTLCFVSRYSMVGRLVGSKPNLLLYSSRVLDYMSFGASNDPRLRTVKLAIKNLGL